MNTSVPAPTLRVSLLAGDHGQPSHINLNGEETITAYPGGDGFNGGFGRGVSHGGNGYSGGGTYCAKNANNNCTEASNGGSAGGDGHGIDINVFGHHTTIMGIGGNGTGEDLKMYHLEHWQITPGAGGKENIAHSFNGTQHLGGGGGGVLVDGTGPKRDPRLGERTGEGYGGGGGYTFTLDTTPYMGLPGVILLEVGP